MYFQPYTDFPQTSLGLNTSLRAVADHDHHRLSPYTKTLINVRAKFNSTTSAPKNPKICTRVQKRIDNPGFEEACTRQTDKDVPNVQQD